MKPTQLEPGFEIGSLQLRRLVAVGGTAAVWEAFDSAVGRQVALKILLDELGGDPARRARLLRETRSYTTLRHPHIVTLYDVGQLDGHPYLVMEWIDGVSLEERLAGPPPTTSEVLSLARQVADGLSAAHACGLAHRDLKPANLMVDEAGEVRLVDFGLAKSVSPKAAVDGTWATVSGVVVGTPEYMSPEQVRGEEVGLASDVFSFGTILYRLLVGASPFAGDGVLATMNAVAAAAPPAPPPSRDRLRCALNDLAMRCLARDPEQRPRDARELVVELDRIADPTRHRPRASRRLGAALLVSGAAAGVIMGLVAAPALRSPPRPPELGLRVLPFEGDLPVLSPDGSAVVYRSVDGREIWTSPVDGGAEQLVWAGLGRVESLALADAGRTVFFTAFDRDDERWIWEVPVTGGVARKVVRGVLPTAVPDPSRLACLREVPGTGFDLVLAERDGSEQRTLSRFDGAESPVATAAGVDGELLVVMTDGLRRSRMVAVDLADGGRRTVEERAGVASAGLAVLPDRRVAVWCLRSVPEETPQVGVTRLDRGGFRVALPGPDRAGSPSLAADGSLLTLSSRERSSELVEIDLTLDGHPDPTTRLRVLPHTRGATQPRVAPAGDRLVFRSPRGNLWLLDRADGSLGPLVTTGESSFNPAFSPDGSRLAYACLRDGRSALWIAGADGSDPIPVTDGLANDFQPGWHPDGRHLVFVSDREDVEDLYLLDLPTGAIRRLGEDGAINPALAPDGQHLAYVVPRRGVPSLLRLARFGDDLGTLSTVWERPVRRDTWAGAKARFSPDSLWLAFDLPADPAGADIWALPVGTANPGDPVRLTALPFPASLVGWFDWSGDQKLVMTVARDRPRILILGDAHAWIDRALR